MLTHAGIWPAQRWRTHCCTECCGFSARQPWGHVPIPGTPTTASAVPLQWVQETGVNSSLLLGTSFRKPQHCSNSPRSQSVTLVLTPNELNNSISPGRSISLPNDSTGHVPIAWQRNAVAFIHHFCIQKFLFCKQNHWKKI